MGQAYLCPAGHCVILPGLCMMSGAGSLPQGIQKKSKCPRTQVLSLAPQLGCDISGAAATVRARMGGRGHRASRLSSSGLPVTDYEDVFLLDPLLACGQRIPLYLSKPPQQVRGSLPPGFPFLSMKVWEDKLPFLFSQAMGSRKLLLPPAIMSPSVHPSSSQACSSTRLSEAEMIALAGLLQMSQGELSSNSLASPLTSSSCPDPVSASEDPGSNGGQSCSGSTDPCPTQTPDTPHP